MMCWRRWKAPPGLRQATTSGHLPLELKGAITVACERPDIAIKWLDWWFSNEGMVLIDYGFEGVNWEWSDTPAIDGSIPSRYFLTERNVLQNTTWYVSTVPYYRPRNRSLAARLRIMCHIFIKAP